MASASFPGSASAAAAGGGSFPTSGGGGVAMADRMRFGELCTLLDTIADLRGAAKRDHLRDFFTAWRRRASKDPNKDSMYPVMRLLLPQLDLDRNSYGLKEQKLADLYLDVLDLGPTTIFGVKLKHWKSETAGAAAGDLPKVALEVLKDRVPTAGDHRHEITLSELNAKLDELADCHNRGKHALDKASANEQVRTKRRDIMRYFQRNATPREHYWLMRIILNDLKIGLKETQVWPAFHEQAAEYWGRCTNLAKLCHDLHLASSKVLEHVRVGEPCGVMLAQGTKGDIEKNLKSMGDFFLEVKYDGERVHLHKDGNEYKYFSRRNMDFTNSYNSAHPQRSHGKNVDGAFVQVHDCILDGEMMGYDHALKEFVHKGENLDVKALGNDNENNLKSFPTVYQCYVVFDMIYLNGEPLYDKPLRERRRLLEAHIKEVPGRLVLAPQKLGHTVEEFKAFAQAAIDEAHEGVIVKKCDSAYSLGNRSRSWLKWKPEYIQDLLDDIDVLVVGAYRGEGRRGGMYSHFMVAVAEPPPKDAPPDAKPKRFLSFGKVGSGYSMKVLRDKNQLLNPHWKPFDPVRYPPCGISSQVLLAMPGYREHPDVWIEPENSIIVQIKAAQITRESEKFAMGCTLRFPRVVRFREDKHWYECMTVDAVHDIVARSHGNLAGGGVLSLQHLEADRPAAKRRPEAPKAKVPAALQKVHLGEVNQRTRMFEGLRFVVRLQDAEEKKAMVQRLAEHGGKQETYPMAGAIIIQDKPDFRLTLENGPTSCNVVKPSWVLACEKAGKRLEFERSHMLWANEETKRLMDENTDVYGDAYETECKMDTFDDIFQRVFPGPQANRGQLFGDRPTVELLDREELAAIEADCLPAVKTFRLCRIYFDVNAVPTDAATYNECAPLLPLALEVVLNGGELAAALDNKCSHVVVAHNDLARLGAIFTAFKAWPLRPKVVSDLWVKDCIRSRVQVEELPYLLKRDAVARF